MQIKKRLRMNAVTSVMLALGVALVLILSLYRINHANKSSIIAEEIITLGFERLSLRNDYIRNNSERAKKQWFSKNEQIDKLLKSAPEHFKDSKDRKIVEAMIETQNSRKEIFSTIVANREIISLNDASANLFLEVEKRLLTQLNMRTYKTVIQSRALKESINEELASALRAAGGCASIFMIIIAVAIINAWKLSRVITDRVTRLQHGAEEIGAGNLDHRINIIGDDEFAGFTKVFNTMTVKLSDSLREHKHAVEALQTLNDLLEKKVEQRTFELQDTQQQYLHAGKLSAIGKLSASIAHEFNNPLQSVLTILKSLQKTTALEEEDKKMLGLAIGESERMKNLIRGLNDFNRPSSGRKIFMDVHQSLESILLLIKIDFNRKNISVVLNYAERLPQILAIPDQIKQVFLNLLINAADACPGNDGVITISTWQVKQRIAVAIQDNGIGIEPEKMDQIFQPFFSTKPEVKGIGLGLSICHGIIQNHHGEIRVVSLPGEGSTFTVLLPINGE